MKKRKLYEAFGEKKSLAEWSRDARCQISSTQLYLRARKKGVIFEEALTLRKRKLGDLYEAFGEKKTITEWSEDPRYKIPLTTLTQRLEIGIPLEEALTYTKGRRRSTPRYKAFGEEKTLFEWTKDSRCPAPYTSLARLVKQGMTVEEAIQCWKEKR